ncbi:MAG: hypothetical protein ACK4SY_04745 [Pyrobaculum sp.]
MEYVKLLAIRYFAETLGMRYINTDGNVAWFEEGLNKVALGFYLTEIYEGAELYKQVGALLSLNAVKIYLAVLPEAWPFVDSKYFKSHGVGLMVVDPSRGVEGVEVKIYAKPRQISFPQFDINKIVDSLKATLLEYINTEIKKLETSLYEKLRKYVDQKLEERRVEKREQPPKRAEEPAERSKLLENEWVRILRSKS